MTIEDAIAATLVTLTIAAVWASTLADHSSALLVDVVGTLDRLCEDDDEQLTHATFSLEDLGAIHSAIATIGEPADVVRQLHARRGASRSGCVPLINVCHDRLCSNRT